MGPPRLLSLSSFSQRREQAAEGCRLRRGSQKGGRVGDCGNFYQQRVQHLPLLPQVTHGGPEGSGSLGTIRPTPTGHVEQQPGPQRTWAPPQGRCPGSGSPSALAAGSRFLHGAAPAPLGRGRPQGCPGGPPRARCREGAQRASVPGGHHPLAGPSQPAGKPLPAGPAAKPPALQRAPRSQLRAQDRSPLPAPRRRGPPTDAPPLGCPGLAGALLRG